MRSWRVGPYDCDGQVLHAITCGSSTHASCLSINTNSHFSDTRRLPEFFSHVAIDMEVTIVGAHSKTSCVLYEFGHPISKALNCDERH